MTTLTNVALATSATATEADVKNFLSSVYNFLAGLFGTDGTKETAISTLGASPFPAGTKMLFAQSTAPTGWTKDTTHNNKALRVVSGTTGGDSGGSVDFSTLFARTAVDGSSLSIAQLAAHTHSVRTRSDGSTGSGTYVGNRSGSSNSDIAGAALSTGSGSTHSHGLDLRVKYVDVIIASKD